MDPFDADEPTLRTVLERREHPRAPLDRKVQLTCEGQLFSGRVEDLSEGGMRLSDVPTLPLEGAIKAFVTLPQGAGERAQMCLVEGSIVWCDTTTVGVRFVDIPPESRQRLRRYVTAYA